MIQTGFAHQTTIFISTSFQFQCLRYGRRFCWKFVYRIQSSGMIIIDSDRQLRHHYKHIPYDETSLPGGELSDLYIDSHNRIWIASLKEGFSLLNPDTHNFTRFNQNNSHLKNNIIRCLVEIQPNKILIGSFSGLSLIDCNTFNIQTFDFDPQKNGSLGHYSIHNFLKDNTGGLWIGTWNGLNYYNPLRKQISTLTPKTFTGVLGKGQEDEDGKIWFTTEGAGLYVMTLPHKNKIYIC